MDNEMGCHRTRALEMSPAAAWLANFQLWNTSYNLGGRGVLIPMFPGTHCTHSIDKPKKSLLLPSEP